MPLSALTGSRLRERRLAQGLRQADLAAQAGISPAYLNLIEHNRRRVGPDILARLATALAIDPMALTAGAEGGLLDDLSAAAATHAGLAEMDRVQDFVGRFPGWAALLAETHRRAEGLSHAVEELNDRLSHDPHLSASLHEMLTAVASVRSTAGILAETEDIAPEWRQKFHANLHQDSERLAAGAEALVAFLDGAGREGSGPAQDRGSASPQEELEQWAAAGDWQLAVLEARISQLASGAAREMAALWLAEARADALALPEAAVRAALAELGPEPLLLAARFGCSPMVAFRRIGLLAGSDTGLVICDGSGTMIFRKPLPGFALPRFGAACPLWPLFQALTQPMLPFEARVRMPGAGGRRFLTRAFAEPYFPQGFGGPVLTRAAMLIFPDDAAPEAASRVVGTSCRICPEAQCPARREPSILRDGL
jgi:transcriptional regulator with XRE-family HTH domain